MKNFFDDDFDFSDFMKLLPMFKDMEQGPFANLWMPGEFTPMMPPMLYMQQIAFNNTMQMMKKFADQAEEFKKKYSPDSSKMMDLGGIKIPAEFFRKLLSIEASPESLEQLQKFLDYSLGMMDKMKK